jgi:tRNA pseudouridine55 synthase
VKAKVTAGVLVVDKPQGPTSHDVVAMVRRALKTREVGHAGTLDPMATGVLVVAVGEATKLVPYLTGAEKTYEARLALGRGTDTLDAMGATTEERPVDDDLARLLDGPLDPLPPRLAAALEAERGRTSQAPPIFSAIQVDGERAYARARRGEEVTLDARPVRVHELAVTAMGSSPSPWLDLRLRADKGYYVRSLGRDLAVALGTAGHLVALRRVLSGGFGVDEALPFPAPREEVAARLLPLDRAAARALPSAALREAGVRDARFGRRVRLEDFATLTPAGAASAWFDEAGALVAVGVVEADGGRVLRGFDGRAS